MSTKPKALARTATVLPAISLAEPKNLAEATAQLDALDAHRRMSGYLFAHRLQWIRDHELYKETHDSMALWFVDHYQDRSTRTMYRILDFADSVPGEVATKYDARKIDAGERLLRTRGKRKGELLITLHGLEAISVKAERNGRMISVPFKHATAEELEAEIVHRRKRQLPPPPPEVIESVDHYNRLFGTGATRIGEARDQRQGSRHVLVLTIDAARLKEFKALFR